MLPTTLEWQLAAGVCALAGLASSVMFFIALAMFLVSILISGLQAYQANVAKQHDGFTSRMIVFLFSYLQPLVRSWARYRTKLFYFNPAASAPWLAKSNGLRFPLTGTQSVDYWSEMARDRLEMLQLAVEFLAHHRWGRIVDSGWTNWDLRIYCHPLVYLEVATTQENHGGNKRLIRVRQKMRPRNLTLAAAGLGALTLGLLAQSHPTAAGAGSVIGIAVAAALWLRATSLAKAAASLFDHIAEELGMIRCDARESKQNTPSCERHTSNGQVAVK
jgi:hypothetical protein